MSHTQGQSGMSGQAQSRTSYEQGGQTASASHGNFPVDNLTYNLISMLHSKLEGLAAYQKYLQDAQGDQTCMQIIQEMQQHDTQMAKRLQEELTNHIGQGGKH